MWIRGRLDIGWKDLFAGWMYTLRPRPRTKTLRDLKSHWGEDRNVLVTLSIRSGLDLLLRATELPPGSEVLVSGVTIPDMIRILESHSLVVKPVDIDRYGHVSLSSLRANISGKTRMLMVAHLFGDRVPMDKLFEAIGETNIVVVEDCAQSFTHVGQTGHSRSDVIMHSFGPIKTATSLGGAVIEVRSRDRFKQMQNILCGDPVYKESSFALRILRFSLLKLVTLYPLSAVLFWFCKLMQVDPDRILNSVGRGFPSGDLIHQLRHRASNAQLSLMLRRFYTYDVDRITRRGQIGRQLDAAIGISRPASHSYWAYPLICQNPDLVIRTLRASGFDATGATRLIVVGEMTSPPLGPQDDSGLPANWSQLVIVPCYAELPDREVDRLARLLGELAPVAINRPQRTLSVFQDAAPCSLSSRVTCGSR